MIDILEVMALPPKEWHDLFDKKLIFNQVVGPINYDKVHKMMHDLAHTNKDSKKKIKAIRDWCDELYDQRNKDNPDLTYYIRVAWGHIVLDDFYSVKSNQRLSQQELIDSAYMSYSHTDYPRSVYNPK